MHIYIYIYIYIYMCVCGYNICIYIKYGKYLTVNRVVISNVKSKLIKAR